ncbi:MAG: carboxymuconolactone decarboxylase family protein [Pseudomonadota bacterium]|nr:carboxymuconolactone decarboxylase family protein [Pseudomonadota bacterium]
MNAFSSRAAAAPSARSPRVFPESGLPERLAPPACLDAHQQAAADALTQGPRGGVYGPFRPLLHKPALLAAVAGVGEVLRYQGSLPAALREWTICVVARELSNVFEWDMHLPLAQAAGVPAPALAALDAGQPLPDDLAGDLTLAHALARQLIAWHRVDEATYAQALVQWGQADVVELIALIGYFTQVCWLMNVARTPGPAG